VNRQEELFQTYRHVAKQVAMYHSRRFHRPIEETLDHAEFAMALLVCNERGYDPARGPMEAWLRFKITMHLKDVYTRGTHPHCGNVREAAYSPERVDTDLLEMADGTTELIPPLRRKPNTGWITRLLAEVSEEASALLEIILDAPQDLMTELCSPHCPQPRRKQNLIEYLINVLDWSEARVTKAVAEVEGCLHR